MGIIKCGAVSAVLLGSAAAAGASTPVQITVRTYNYYRVPAGDLDIARQSARVILVEAGIDIEWLDCPVERDAADAPTRCLTPIGPTDLILRIGTASGATTSLVSMGYSLVNASDGKPPYLSTVYADVVASVARTSAVDSRELLGRAIAHELGHLLLASNLHGHHGLMRAIWSQAELRKNVSVDWLFERQEATVMRAAVDQRAAR